MAVISGDGIIFQCKFIRTLTKYTLILININCYTFSRETFVSAPIIFNSLSQTIVTKYGLKYLHACLINQYPFILTIYN